MMRHLTPNWLLFIGVIGLIIGVVLPFLMTIRVIEPTFLLNIIAYFASFGGLVVGMVGITLYWQENRAENEDDYYWRQ
jgi:NAD/NADP transhydrogenase beta subunit